MNNLLSQAAQSELTHYQQLVPPKSGVQGGPSRSKSCPWANNQGCSGSKMVKTTGPQNKTRGEKREIAERRREHVLLVADVTLSQRSRLRNYFNQQESSRRWLVQQHQTKRITLQRPAGASRRRSGKRVLLQPEPAQSLEMSLQWNLDVELRTDSTATHSARDAKEGSNRPCF